MTFTLLALSLGACNGEQQQGELREHEQRVEPLRAAGDASSGGITPIAAPGTGMGATGRPSAAQCGDNDFLGALKPAFAPLPSQIPGGAPTVVRGPTVAAPPDLPGDLSPPDQVVPDPPADAPTPADPPAPADPPTLDLPSLTPDDVPGLIAMQPPRPLSPADLDSLAPLLNAAELDAVSSFTQQPLIGGEPKDKNNNPYPWASLLVMVRSGNSLPFCSGALIGPRLVATAAHCAELLRNGDVVFVGGTHLETDPGTPHPVKARALHQCFDAQTKQHDIALLELGDDAAFPLLGLGPGDASLDSPPAQRTVVAWGRGTAPGTLEVKQLQDLDVQLVALPACDASYPGDTITDRMVCAGSLGATTCYGDSGGALIAASGGTEQMIGIASLTGSCVVPGVFSRVSAYAGWLTGLPDP